MKVIVVIDASDDIVGYTDEDIVDWIKDDLADWQIVNINIEED